jgi:lipoprotein NlpD
LKRYNSGSVTGFYIDDSAKGTRSSLILQLSMLVRFVIFFTTFMLVLSACTPTYAPVEKRSIKPYKSRDYYSKYSKISEYYTVRRGDTLYSIAWNYGLDYKSLARLNNITYPYTIFAGKKLQLYSGKTTHYKSKTVKSRSKGHSKESKKQKYKNASVKAGTKSKKDISKKDKSNKLSTKAKFKTTHSSSSQKNSQSKNKSQIRKKTYTVTTVSKTKVSKTKYNKSKTTKSRSVSFTGNKQLRWGWPVKGKLLQGYAPAKGKKGIDIGAKEGTQIKAAEGGKVVYSGQGLRGYGLLLIIKHNETFLSAYAHNQSLLTNEGQIVKKGQVIARLGNTGTDRNKLHFEIRKNGKPVNPLNYLP